MDPLTTQSKFLSLLLRHNPSRLNLTMDKNGWVEVQQIIDNSKNNKTEFTKEIIETIVSTDTKQRYAFNSDKTRIRANQGHSLEVDVGLVRKAPPEFLYHGTSTRNLDSIRKDGLNKMGRQYIHLSMDESTAKNVGTRHGVPIVIKVLAGDMNKYGYPFFLSKNNVWLTDSVPPSYLKIPGI